MAKRADRVLCLSVIAANAAFASQYTLASWLTDGPSLFGAVGGGLATISALLFSAWLVLQSRGRARGWAKAAFVLVAVGPLAWWLVAYPPATDLICIDCVLPADYREQRLGDVKQAQFALAILAWGGFACAGTSAFTQERSELMRDSRNDAGKDAGFP